MPRPTVKSHREGGGESVQSMTATRDTHESMHALVDKVQIAILVADQRESWPTLAFLDGRGQVPALVPSPWSRLRWQHNEEEGALPASRRAQMNAHLPRLLLLPPHYCRRRPPRLIFRDKATTHWHHRPRTDGRPTIVGHRRCGRGAIRVANKAAERRRATKAAGEGG